MLPKSFAQMHGDVQALLNSIAEKSGTHCGIPVGILTLAKSQSPQDAPALIELSPEYLSMLIKAGLLLHSDVEKAEKPKPQSEHINSWPVKRKWKGKFGNVSVWKKPDGKVFLDFEALDPAQDRLRFLTKTITHLSTLGIAAAERKARSKLEKLLAPEQQDCLLLTDTFFEMGKSGVVYIIRRNRPTLAFRMDHGHRISRPLCALCLHPLGWYIDSFAGILPPSDDMIAHLLMIRADEYLFWKKANQHQLHVPQAGV